MMFMVVWKRDMTEKSFGHYSMWKYIENKADFNELKMEFGNHFGKKKGRDGPVQDHRAEILITTGHLI